MSAAGTSCPAQLLPKPVGHPAAVQNRRPTPQDLLELSARIYKSTRRLYAEADSQGLRVYHDELIVGDVRLVMLVPAWFPKAHVAFDWDRLQGERLSVVLVMRGTMQDLVGNTKANLQLVYNKLVDDQHLPDTAVEAVKLSRAWLHTLLLRHPQLDLGLGSNSSDAPPAAGQQQQEQPRRLHLDVHVTGHSLGGLLAEVATVESAGFAAQHGMEWHCTSFESPGLPDLYYNSALRMHKDWDDVCTSYLAAPNVINMLYRHLGRIIHVVVPWEQTWTFVAKCVGADVARVTAWAIVGGMALAGAKQLSVVARRHVEDEAANSAAAAAAGQLPLALPQCDARLAQLPEQAAAAARAATATVGPPAPEFLIVAATPSSSSDVAGAAGRRLLSVASFPAAATGAGAAAAAGAGAATQPPALTAAMVGVVAAAGDAAASLGGARILHGVLRRSGLGTLATVLGGWAFGRSGPAVVMECLAGVLGVEELCVQHQLGPMRQCFCPHTGELKPRFCRKMAAWPHLETRGRVILTAAKQVAKWTLPSFVCRDNVGVANITSRTAMVEARCARLQGYEVLEDTQELQEALGTAAAPAPVGELDAAAATEGMTLPLLDAATDMAAEQQAYEEEQQQQQEALLERSHAARASLPRALRMLVQQQQQQQQHTQHAEEPAPHGLGGVGLGHRSHQQQHSTRASSSRQEQHAAPAAVPAPSLLELHECDGMLVDADDLGAAGTINASNSPMPLGGLFEADAVAVSAGGLLAAPAPAPAPTAAAAPQGFIRLQDEDMGGIGGPYEAVHMSAAAAGGGHVSDMEAEEEEERVAWAGRGLGQLHLAR